MNLAAFAPALLLFALTPASAADDAKQGSWRPLLDGTSLDGWEHIGPGKMVVDNGAIRTEGGMGLLWYTREKFGNCVIRVVYKTMDKQSNAGVFIRIADKPKDPWYAVHHGFEVQICDSEDEYHRTGAIYSLSKSTSLPSKVGEWNTMEITLKGDRITVTVNGVQVNDFDSNSTNVPERKKDYEPERGPRPPAGYIGVQNHDDFSGGSKSVYFKEVSVRPL
jgi:3-keto-disaccharide hydrolase